MRRALAYFAAFTGMGALFAGTLLLAAVLLGVRPTGATESATPRPSAPSGEVGMLEIHAFDLGFEPAAAVVPQAGVYTVHFVNDGGILHNLTFDDGTVIAADAHQTATGTVTIPAGGLAFLCSVPGHADAGMRGTVSLGEAGTPQPSQTMTPEQMRDADAAVTAQFPAKTAGKGGVLLEATVLPDGTKQWELTASVFQWETEPGKFVEAWGYNGMVPGPELRAQVGDRVRIILHNQLPAPTTIHFHGMLVPNAMDGVPVISQPAVMPGESFTYEFTVRNAGSNMYHSHFMAQSQVPLGLLGALVISDPNDKADPPSDIDYAMVLNDGPLGFTLNGKGFPATEPIVAKLGQTVRVRYMNEGLQIHPMHLHGLPQLVIAKDGFLLPDPHYEDTVLVAPGERVDVLIKASELGIWAFHCHILTHAETDHGMFGMVTALIVQQ
ncbi:MAG: multicopper oxidase domain-containing protein [Candidatus Limnocylindria bacterium]